MNALATAPGVIATPGKYYIGAQEVMEYLDCKERGKMPCQIVDERWFIYVDRQEEGFLLRYFKAWRHIKN